MAFAIFHGIQFFLARINLIMEKNIPLHLQEVIFGSKNPKISNQISKLVKIGAIRKIAPRIYSPNMYEPIIKRNLFKILGNLYPGTLLSLEVGVPCNVSTNKHYV